MKFLIVADTHGINTNKLIEVIKKEKADINIHAGDYMIPISEMKKYFKYFVDGNNDSGYKAEDKFIIDGINFWLLHGDRYFSFDYEGWIENERNNQIDVDVIIFGHSHISLIDMKAKPYFINPGSFSLPRESKKKTYIIGEIVNGKINFQLKNWD